jgi:hypothetical protein
LLLLSVCDDALRLRGDSSVRSNKVVCFFDIVRRVASFNATCYCCRAAASVLGGF